MSTITQLNAANDGNYPAQALCWMDMKYDIASH